MNILLVEDEIALGRTIALNLKRAGYAVEHRESAEEALQLLSENRNFQLSIVDIGLKGKMTGIDLCQKIRERKLLLPVIFLTARNLLEDKEAAFHAGGDDYLTKPFQIKELLLRIEARTRNVPRIPDQIRIGEKTLDLVAGRVSGGGTEELRLNERELRILRLFIENRGKPVSRDVILDQVWGTDYPSNRTVDNFIVKFRKIFEKDPSSPRLFLTRHGLGYELTHE
ncbi:MAG: response regulator transcription factor [Spirochaetales bacterium]|nr:response regulator transcription factor [Spirochaetales bacterium]